MRGLGCDLGIVDECFFVNPEAFRIGPLAFMLDGAIIICGSSPNTGNSDILTMMHETDANGEERCEFIDFKLECAICEEIRNKFNKSHICKHRLGVRPDHMPLENVETAMMFMQSYQDRVSREIFGSAASDSNIFFSPESVNYMERCFCEDNDTGEIQFLFASFDPSGASRHYHDGHTSDYAFVTGYRYNGRWIVSFLFLFCLFIAFREFYSFYLIFVCSCFSSSSSSSCGFC